VVGIYNNRSWDGKENPVSSQVGPPSGVKRVGRGFTWREKKGQFYLRKKTLESGKGWTKPRKGGNKFRGGGEELETKTPSNPQTVKTIVGKTKWRSPRAISQLKKKKKKEATTKTTRRQKKNFLLSLDLHRKCNTTKKGGTIGGKFF